MPSATQAAAVVSGSSSTTRAPAVSPAARAISTYAAHSGFVIDAETGDVDVVHAISSAAARTTPAAGR
jgi:hypothetical protein